MTEVPHTPPTSLSLSHLPRRNTSHNVPFPASGKFHLCLGFSSPHKGHSPLRGPLYLPPWQSQTRDSHAPFGARNDTESRHILHTPTAPVGASIARPLLQHRTAAADGQWPPLQRTEITIPAFGERPDRRRGRKQGGERVAAVGGGRRSKDRGHPPGTATGIRNSAFLRR